MIGGVTSADYMEKAKDSIGEDSRNMGELATKDAWELILDNIPKERDSEEKSLEDKIERES